MTPKPTVPRRDVEVVRPDYQPNKAELEEDMRVNATFKDAVDALTRPVSIRYIDRPERADREGERP